MTKTKQWQDLFSRKPAIEQMLEKIYWAVRKSGISIPLDLEKGELRFFMPTFVSFPTIMPARMYVQDQARQELSIHQ